MKQALLAGRKKALPKMSWHFFVLEMLAVLFPAVACMVWPQLTVTLVLSMAITSESLQRSCLGDVHKNYVVVI